MASCNSKNTTLVKWNTRSLGLSITMLLNHRKCNASRSLLVAETTRKAFSMSAMSELALQSQNLRRSNILSWVNVDPAWRLLLRDNPVDLAKASQTILCLVVSFTVKTEVCISYWGYAHSDISGVIFKLSMSLWAYIWYEMQTSMKCTLPFFMVNCCYGARLCTVLIVM